MKTCNQPMFDEADNVVKCDKETKPFFNSGGKEFYACEHGHVAMDVPEDQE